MKSLLAEGRGEGEAYASTFAGISKWRGPYWLPVGVGAEGKTEVLRPLESEKTFLLVQVKLTASQEMETLAPLFRSVVCFSFPFLFLRFLPCYFLPPPSFFFFLFLSSLVRIYHDVSRIQQGLNEDIFVAFIGSCQNADPREQFDNRDDARKIDDLRDELQADDADQSYV